VLQENRLRSVFAQIPNGYFAIIPSGREPGQTRVPGKTADFAAMTIEFCAFLALATVKFVAARSSPDLWRKNSIVCI
jgi:hypothetical protein